MLTLVNIWRCNMIDAIENSRIEFKIKLVDDLEGTVIGFFYVNNTPNSFIK